MLGVFGLSHYTRQRDLEDIFSKFGPVKEVSLVMDRRVLFPFKTSLPLIPIIFRAINLEDLVLYILTLLKILKKLWKRPME